MIQSSNVLGTRKAQCPKRQFSFSENVRPSVHLSFNDCIDNILVNKKKRKKEILKNRWLFMKIITSSYHNHQNDNVADTELICRKNEWWLSSCHAKKIITLTI